MNYLIICNDAGYLSVAPAKVLNVYKADAGETSKLCYEEVCVYTHFYQRLCCM